MLEMTQESRFDNDYMRGEKTTNDVGMDVNVDVN